MTARAVTRTVGIVGNGIAAFAAAAAFRRALPHARVTAFVGGDPADGPDYAGAAAPYIHAFHRLIGLESETFRWRTGAVTVREAEISRAGAPPFRLVPLHDLPYVEGAALHQLWLRRTSQDARSAPAWAAVARRTQSRDDAAEGLGVRFDPAAYLALLRDLAVHLGVVLVDDIPDTAKLAHSLDLTIETRPVDGADWLPLDGVPASLDWSFGRPAGLDETDVEAVEISGAQVVWANGAWQARADTCRSATGGRIAAPWQGNVLAVGRAAVRCETLDGQPLAAALAAIARAIELLPRPGAAGLEPAEYNRRTSAVHDFLLDWAAERWNATATPPGLAALREQFGHRGRIPFRDEDPIPPGHWLGWFLGAGVRPDALDLTASAVPEDRLAAIFAGF